MNLEKPIKVGSIKNYTNFKKLLAMIVLERYLKKT